MAAAGIRSAGHVSERIREEDRPLGFESLPGQLRRGRGWRRRGGGERRSAHRDGLAADHLQHEHERITIRDADVPDEGAVRAEDRELEGGRRRRIEPELSALVGPGDG
jgi:hypothetical protein